MNLKKSPLHDTLFKEIYGNHKYSMDIFRLVLSDEEFDLFDWRTLKPETTVFVDGQFKEKRTDLSFGVNLKKTGKSVRIVFLLEHKSSPAPFVLQKLLAYQTCFYGRERSPMIPILVYHGKEEWRSSVEFQDSLEGMTGDVKLFFGRDVLNFTCRFLNFKDVKNWKKKDLTTLPILYIMANIWHVSEQIIVNLFKLLQRSSRKDRRKLQESAMNYIHSYNDKLFTWKKLEEIEKNTFKKGDRIMSLMKYSLDQERQEGREEGRQKGREETAMAMIQDNADIRMIQRYTKLTREQIAKLKEKLKKIES